MPFRFFQRIRIAPGVRLNLSKGGVSVSAGPRGAQFTMGTSGTRATAGLPGTGLHYTVLNPHRKIKGLAAGATQTNSIPVTGTAQVRTPKMSWLQRLTLGGDSKQFINGWQAWGKGDITAALACFNDVSAVSNAGADAAWSAGILYTQREDYVRAIACLQRALKTPAALGKAFKEHGFTPKVQVPVTPEIVATMLPSAQSASLLLAEVQQSIDDHPAALATLNLVLPNQASAAIDPVMLAAFGELALESQDANAIHRFNTLAAAIENDSAIHTVVMYYRAQGLVNQNLHSAALALLTPALRRTKDRSTGLLLNIRFLRAEVYGALGRKALARKDLERIYAEDPSFEGIRQALGMV